VLPAHFQFAPGELVIPLIDARNHLTAQGGVPVPVGFSGGIPMAGQHLLAKS
jgi:hypothetical protein